MRVCLCLSIQWISALSNELFYLTLAIFVTLSWITLFPCLPWVKCSRIFSYFGCLLYRLILTELSNVEYGFILDSNVHETPLLTFPMLQHHLIGWWFPFYTLRLFLNFGLLHLKTYLMFIHIHLNSISNRTCSTLSFWPSEFPAGSFPVPPVLVPFLLIVFHVLQLSEFSEVPFDFLYNQF